MRVVHHIIHHLKHFGIVWVLLIVLLLIMYLAPEGYSRWGRLFVLGLFIFICIWPMNAVYGLIGTSGNIRRFMWLIIVINLLFSGIYYWGVFKNAGISYDTDPPYISYGMFKEIPRKVFSPFLDTTLTVVDTTRIESFDTCESRSTIFITKTDNSERILFDTLVAFLPPLQTNHYFTSTVHYHNVDYWTVLQNTLITSLIQEPSDLFSVAASYSDIGSEQQNLNGVKDGEISRLFRWVLILQVLISWIFFGVFISILYNKFRYES